MTKLPVYRQVPVMEFECPFCGGYFGVSETEYFVYHLVPPCENFKKLDATEFIQAVNLKLGNYLRPDEIQ